MTTFNTFFTTVNEATCKQVNNARTWRNSLKFSRRLRSEKSEETFKRKPEETRVNPFTAAPWHIPAPSPPPQTNWPMLTVMSCSLFGLVGDQLIIHLKTTAGAGFKVLRPGSASIEKYKFAWTCMNRQSILRDWNGRVWGCVCECVCVCVWSVAPSYYVKVKRWRLISGNCVETDTQACTLIVL